MTIRSLQALVEASSLVDSDELYNAFKEAAPFLDNLEQQWGIPPDHQSLPLGILLLPWEFINQSGGGGGGDSEGPVMKDCTGLGLGLGSLSRPARERNGRYPKPLRSAWREWGEAEEYATRWEVLSPEEGERERVGRRLRRETNFNDKSSKRFETQPEIWNTARDLG
ncbi:hypothetical protein F5876DRAFT_70495 [Lentinula aff. lateritia]|uniref:Uncharacterized protein n=1 Tax=Lentinula aff. lateritia TaxID=2804960 RepID=A0ACC1TIR8_9AGAR|nr:hypothetical protein F5876DRAFT_70495 [Lentinula aff. lateritia]